MGAAAQDPAADITPPVHAVPSPTATLIPQTDTQVDADVARPGTAPSRSVSPAPAIAPTGAPLQLGSFLFYPQLEATWAYDSNLYSTNTDTLSDHAWIYSPALWVQSNWAKHALNFHASADLIRYETYGTENTDDQRISAEGRYDFSADSNLYGGMYFSQDHEDRESPTVRNGVTPTKYFQRRYYGGYFRQLDRFSLRIAGTAQHLNYEDVDFITGGGALSTINNDDRDLWQYTGGFRLGYELSPRLEPYLQIAFDNRRYNDATDDLNFTRDSSGQRYLVGLRWNEPRKLKIDAFAGWLNQDYDDAGLKDVNDPVFGMALQWAATDKTTVSVHLDRTVEETTVVSVPAPSVLLVSSSFLNTFASAGVDHRFTEKLFGRVSGSVSRVDYQGIDRVDEYYGATIGMTYRFHRNFFTDVNYTRRELKSTIPTEDFDRDLVFVRLVVPFSH